MKNTRLVQQNDLASLRMENELLAYEVAHVRARLRHLERELAEHHADQGRKGELADLRGELSELRELHRLTSSEFRWFLRRLDGSPVGWMLRRRSGFRKLLERYATDG